MVTCKNSTYPEFNSDEVVLGSIIEIYGRIKIRNDRSLRDYTFLDKYTWQGVKIGNDSLPFRDNSDRYLIAGGDDY